MKQIKAVFVGSPFSGKTSFLIKLTTSIFREEYIPTVFDTYSFTENFDDNSVVVGLWDTGKLPHYWVLSGTVMNTNAYSNNIIK